MEEKEEEGREGNRFLSGIGQELLKSGHSGRPRPEPGPTR